MISFFVEEVPFTLKDKLKLKTWIKHVCLLYNKKPGDLNYIFCNDDYLLEINKTYLNHDFYTDIITFDQSESEDMIEGEIYISVDRVKENAENNNIDFPQELKRVIIHGILHLIGFKDKTEQDSKKMRLLENQMLEIIK
ncbi:MAG: rRNA maturation RNase YbeY [Bacteroidota bacterium]